MKSYFFNIRPWWGELHWFLQVMSPPICSSQTPPFIIIMLGLLYCGESFSIINMIRFVIISSSDEQACKLLPRPKMYYMCIQVTRLKERAQSILFWACVVGLNDAEGKISSCPNSSEDCSPCFSHTFCWGVILQRIREEQVCKQAKALIGLCRFVFLFSRK